MPTTRTIEPTPFQARVLAFRRHASILNAGGRGGGKSFSLLLDALDHCRDRDARPLVLRESVGGLSELVDELHELAVAAFGSRVRVNRQEGTLRLPNGVTVALCAVSDESTYQKLQGRSFSALYADEVGNYSPPGYTFFRRTMSNLRAPKGKRTHVHATANPHGRSHARVVREFGILKREPWAPFVDPFGETWVVAHSTLDDNPHVDGEAYRRKLLASAGNDTSLARAWIAGDWSVLGGAMFGDVFDPRQHVLAKVPPLDRFRFRLLVGCDWGTASPSVALLVGALRDPVGYFRPGDLFVFDEIDTAVPDDLATGTGASIQAWAEDVRALLRRNGLQRPPELVTDDARGLAGDTVVQELRRCGLPARRPNNKNRVAGWARIRTLLQCASNRRDGPGLWISERCPHLLETLPEAPRSPLRAEDIDPRWKPDHWLDALSYALGELHGIPAMKFGRTTGHY